MAKKVGVRQVTEFVIGVGRLAFIGVLGVLAFLALIMVANLLLWTLARTVDALLDLLKNGIFGD